MHRGRYILVLAMAAMAECAVALCGWRLPLLPLCVFYAGMARHARRLFPESVVAAALLDALWCHTLPAEVLSVLAAVVLAAAVSDYAALTSWVAMAFCGAAVGGCAALVTCVARMNFSDGGSVIFATNLLGGFLLAPPLFALLERFLRRRGSWNPEGGGVAAEDGE